MSQIEQAYEIIAAAPEGMTSRQLGERMGMSHYRASTLASRAALYGALDRIPHPGDRGNGRQYIYRAPRSA